MYFLKSQGYAENFSIKYASVALKDEIDTFTYAIKFGKYDQDGSGDEYIPVASVGFYADLIEEYAQEYKYTTSILKLNKIEIIGNVYKNPELLEEKK